MIAILVALTPLALALLLMAVFGKHSHQAGLLTLALTCAIALVVPPFRLAPARLLTSLGTGVATSLTVLTVLLPALLLYQLQSVSGGIRVLARGFAQVTPDRDLQVLLLILGLEPFIESLCGFGAGIVVIVPMLVNLRLDIRRVALLSVLGQLTAAWGAMGVALTLASTITGLPEELVGTRTALLLGPTTIGFSLIILLLSGGMKAVRQWWGLAVGAGSTLTGEHGSSRDWQASSWRVC